MNVGVVGCDDKVAIGPLGIFVNADEERQGELFEQVVVEAPELVIGQGGEDGAVHDRFFRGVTVSTIPGTQKIETDLDGWNGNKNHAKHDVAKQRDSSGFQELKLSFASLTTLRDSSE